MRISRSPLCQIWRRIVWKQMNEATKKEKKIKLFYEGRHHLSIIICLSRGSGDSARTHLLMQAIMSHNRKRANGFCVNMYEHVRIVNIGIGLGSLVYAIYAYVISVSDFKNCSRARLCYCRNKIKLRRFLILFRRSVFHQQFNKLWLIERHGCHGVDIDRSIFAKREWWWSLIQFDKVTKFGTMIFMIFMHEVWKMKWTNRSNNGSFSINSGGVLSFVFKSNNIIEYCTFYYSFVHK